MRKWERVTAKWKCRKERDGARERESRCETEPVDSAAEAVSLFRSLGKRDLG